MQELCGMCERINKDKKLSGSYNFYECTKTDKYVDITSSACYSFKAATDTCAMCRDFNWNNQESYATRFRCTGISRYVSPFDKRYYCNHDRNRSSSSSSSTPPCFITTMICNVLGYSDDCELLNILRNFRENYLKRTVQYIPLLLEYDQVGPIISQKIQEYNNQENLCLYLTKHFLYPCVVAIKEEKYEDAILTYEDLVITLKELFNIPNINIEIPKNVDMNILGKGRLKTI